MKTFQDKLMVSRYPSVLEPKQRKGKWLIDNKPNSRGYSFMYCSICKSYYTIGNKEEFNYCPNCGAEMVNAKLKNEKKGDIKNDELR